MEENQYILSPRLKDCVWFAGADSPDESAGAHSTAAAESIAAKKDFLLRRRGAPFPFLVTTLRGCLDCIFYVVCVLQRSGSFSRPSLPPSDLGDEGKLA